MSENGNISLYSFYLFHFLSRFQLGIDDPNDEDVDEVFASFAVLQRRKTREANQVGDVGANTPKKAVVRSKEEVLAAAKVSPVVSDDEIFYDADEETPPSSEEVWLSYSNCFGVMVIASQASLSDPLLLSLSSSAIIVECCYTISHSRKLLP